MADMKQGIDKELIRDLAALLKETELSEIEIEQDDFRIRISRGGGMMPVSYAEPQRAPAAHAAQSEAGAPKTSLADPARHPGCVPSPMVGTAYRSPDPGAKPFVDIGDVVQAGADDSDRRSDEAYERSDGATGWQGGGRDGGRRAAG
jgi:acetyl-CoA carboxylase biotin carboxyl carrier protein